MEYSEEESRLQEITNEVLSARQVLRTGSKKLHWDVAYSNLAIALGNLYELTGDIDVLKETIEVSRKAMSLCSTDDPDWLERCADLASYLVDLFQLTDDGNLLDEAIELNREALTLYPIDEPDWEPTRDVFCRALAIPLEHRYSQTGDIGALEEAIELNREALALRSYGTEEWRYACDYVAKALYKRYVYARDERDIREAISLLREAMSLCPLSERNHIFAAICQDLSVSLGILFEVTADTALSDEALNLARMAMHLPYKSHHDRPDRVGLLCHQLWERYQHSQQIDLLIEMMRYSSEILTMKNAVYHDEVLVLTALAHLKEDTPYYNVSLSLSYMTRLLEIPATDSVWLWTSLLEYSDALVVPHVLQSPSAALTALKIVSSAMDVISHRAGLMLDPQHQLRNIREASKFGMNALTIATYAGNPSVGLELLEYTRGFMWSQALRIHDPKLMSLPRDMAAELSTLFKAMCHKPSLSLKSFQLDEELKRRIITEIRHRKAIQIENILKHARTLPGMENFMKGPSNIQLAELSRTCPHIVVVLAATGQHTQAFILRPSDRGAADQKHELTVVSLPLLNGKMKTLFKTLPGVTSRGTDSYKSFEDSGVSRMMRVDKHRPHMKGLETLWTDVVKPILRSLELSRIPGSQDRPRLHWCPTGELTFLPLHAAGIYRLEAANAECCADYVVSSYTPTLSALIRAREEAGILEVSKAHIALVGDAATASAPDKGHTLPFLPNVQLELGNIEAMANAARVGYLETHRDNINIANITSAFSSADIIHLACHGVQDAQDALSSGFCLGDGRFSVLDIMKLSLGRRMFAFLSACETAKGDEDQPDEVVHLAASMLFLGFRSIVATMWAINDSDGPRMASWFYEELLSKPTISIEDIPLALDKAVSKLRAQGVSPERWVPFIHMGA